MESSHIFRARSFDSHTNYYLERQKGKVVRTAREYQTQLRGGHKYTVERNCERIITMHTRVVNACNAAVEMVSHPSSPNTQQSGEAEIAFERLTAVQVSALTLGVSFRTCVRKLLCTCVSAAWPSDGQTLLRRWEESGLARYL